MIVVLLQKMKQMDIEHWENIRVPRPWKEDFGDAEKR